MRGLETLQSMLGRSNTPQPKRKRDDEAAAAQEDRNRATRVVAPPSQRSGTVAPLGPKQRGKGSKAPLAQQPAWDWARMKPVPKAPTSPPARSQSQPTLQHATLLSSPIAGRSPTQQRGSVSTSPSSSPAGHLSITCFVVGGRHRGQEAEACGLRLAALGKPVVAQLAREPSNPKDANAIQVLYEDSVGPCTDGRTSTCILGHIPARLAEHLAPLLDEESIVVTPHLRANQQGSNAEGSPAVEASGSRAASPVAQTKQQQQQQQQQQAPRLRRAASLGVVLQLELQCRVHPGLALPRRQEVLDKLAVAQADAADLVAGWDSGSVLRDKFLFMLTELRKLDGHLFSVEELQTMDVMRNLQPAQQSLLLRLFLRKGPWFDLMRLEYREVDDPEQCGAALVCAGLLLPPARGDCRALVEMMSATKALAVANTIGITSVGSGTRKQDLVAALLSNCTCTSTASQLCLQRSMSLEGRTSSGGTLGRRASSTGNTCNHTAAAGAKLGARTSMRRHSSEIIASKGTAGNEILPDAAEDCLRAAQAACIVQLPGCASPPRTQGVAGDAALLGGSPFKLAATQIILDDSDDDGNNDVKEKQAIQLRLARQADGTAGRNVQQGGSSHHLQRGNDSNGHESGAQQQAEGSGHWLIDLTQDEGDLSPVFVPAQAGASSQKQPTYQADQDMKVEVQVEVEGKQHNARLHRRQGLPPRPSQGQSAAPPAHQGPQPERSGMHRSGSGLEGANAAPVAPQSSSGPAGPAGAVDVARGGSGEQRKGCCLQAQLLAQVGPCVRVAPHVTSLLQRMQRVYLLNEAHDMSRWMAAGRGALPYPTYTINRTQSAFPSRKALLAYEDALAHAGSLDECIEANNLEGARQALQPAWQALAAGELKRVKWITATSPAAATATAQQEQDPAEMQEDQPNTQLDECQKSSDTEPGHGGNTSLQNVATGRVAPCQHPASSNEQQPQPLFLARFCSAWVYATMCTVGVSLHEKAREYKQAVGVLRALLDGNCCPGRRGEWWVRLSIDLEHLDDDEAALQAAEAGVQDPWVRHGDLVALKRRVVRLGKPPRRWKKPAWAAAIMAEPPEVVITGRPLSSNTGVKSKFYAVNGRQVSVEQLALEHYASEPGGGWCGVHCEGGVWMSLAGQLLWDCLFSSHVPDVFRTPFQTAPLDLDTDAFYPARKEQIDARLQLIASGGAAELLAACWAQHRGQWCRGVSWDAYSLEQLQEIARCVGGLGLSVVCRKIAEDHGGVLSGMPDLLLWRPEAAKQDAMLAEVKGPRDRLSDAQRAWITALTAAGVHCEVLRVQEPK